MYTVIHRYEANTETCSQIYFMLKYGVQFLDLFTKPWTNLKFTEIVGHFGKWIFFSLQEKKEEHNRLAWLVNLNTANTLRPNFWKSDYSSRGMRRWKWSLHFPTINWCLDNTAVIRLRIDWNFKLKSFWQQVRTK